MMLQYRDLTKLRTKKIVYEDVVAVIDSVSLEHLKELSSKRRVIEESINQTSFITEAIAREISGGVTSRCEQQRLRLEQYLPILENLIYHADVFAGNQMARWISQLRIQWSSALSSSSIFNFMGPRFYQVDNLRYELGMTLFLYGGTLRERAVEVLPADIKQSALIFREAAGVFHYLAHEVLPYLQTSVSVEWPPEATSSVCSAMSLICLAEAQGVYVRKAEEAGTSCGALAKLHHGVAELLTEARGAFYSDTGESKAISPRFLEFLSSCKVLHELQSLKYLAESLKNDGRIGVAIGVLRYALINVKKKTPGEESWKEVFQREIESAAEVLRKFEHENEFVWHERIPFEDELPTPKGNKIVQIVTYKPQRWERQLVFKI